MTEQAAPHPFDVLLQIDQLNQQSTAGAAESAHATAEEGHLAVRLGTFGLLFSMDDVSEIVPVPRVTAVPGVKSWLLGIANLRGTILSVIDLQAFFGGEPSVLTPSSRLVVVGAGEWEYGLLVQEIIGMRHANRLQPLREAVKAGSGLAQYVSAGFEGDNQQWWLFDVNRLLNEPQFLNATV